MLRFEHGVLHADRGRGMGFRVSDHLIAIGVVEIDRRKTILLGHTGTYRGLRLRRDLSSWRKSSRLAWPARLVDDRADAVISSQTADAVDGIAINSCGTALPSTGQLSNAVIYS